MAELLLLELMLLLAVETLGLMELVGDLEGEAEGMDLMVAVVEDRELVTVLAPVECMVAEVVAWVAA